jgi:hypothetical protein
MNAPKLRGLGAALAGLEVKIRAAVEKAHREGRDFVHGPLSTDAPDPFVPFDITRPIRYAVEVRGGPVDPGQEWPADWTHYRCPAAEFEAGAVAPDGSIWLSPEMRATEGVIDLDERWLVTAVFHGWRAGRASAGRVYVHR